MNNIVRREFSATIGAPLPGFYLLVFYVYGLGSALLVGTAVHNPTALGVATGMWVIGQLAVVIGAAACLDRFARSARDLRLPDHAATMVRIYALLCTFLVIVPIIFFRILIPEGPQLIWTTSIMPLCLLWPGLLRFVRPHRPLRTGAVTSRRLHPIGSPSDAIRVYLGSAFALVPLASRKFGLRLLVVLLWSSPLVLVETTLVRPARWLVPLYLGVTASVVWIWLMNSLAGFIRSRSAIYADLALLPGLGNPASQRRAFYFAALSRPMYLCFFFSALEFMWVWSTSHAWRNLVLLGCVFFLITLMSGYNILGQLLFKRTARGTTRFQRVYQLSYVPVVLIYSASSIAGRFPLTLLTALVLAAAIMQVISWRHARRLAQLPHPFLQ